MANFRTLRTRIILLSMAIIFTTALAYILTPLLISKLATSHLRSVFAEQQTLLTAPIASLGVSGKPSYRFQCSDERHTHWQTELMCQNFAVYKHNAYPISAQAKETYATNATKFDQLLKQNGWTPDRPQDPVTTLAESNPYLPQNNGRGSSVLFHKNLGSVSCNLKIDFNPLNDANNSASPGAINVNEFSCSQHVTFFMLHPTNWHATGP